MGTGLRARCDRDLKRSRVQGDVEVRGGSDGQNPGLLGRGGSCRELGPFPSLRKGQGYRAVLGSLLDLRVCNCRREMPTPTT